MTINPSREGTAGEAIGMVIDGRRFANEQSIVLGDPRVIVARDQLGPHLEALGRFDKPFESLGVRWGLLLLGIVQDRQIVSRTGPFLLGTATALEILSRDFDDERPVTFRHVVGRDRGDAADLPLLVALELHPQQRDFGTS